MNKYLRIKRLLKRNPMRLSRCFSVGFAVTPNAELSAGKIIPVPILPPALAKQLDTGKGRLSALIIDPLLTGLSIRLTVRL
ncbi:hypothetical protein [Treponema vincentii]|uniref:hypothetical protein n=1 Tax=Treponema vincentii TaxID=69710 RepID=UPI0036D97192